MTIQILMPKLSPTMTEGKLIKWLKKEGDKIEIGDIIAEIETDKATMELESLDEGRLGKILIKEGNTPITIKKPIGIIIEKNENISVLKEKPEEKKPISYISKEIKKNIIHEKKTDRIFISPLANRLLKQNNLNIKLIKGSGPNKRIIKSDIENYILSQSNKNINFTNQKTKEIITLNTTKRIELSSIRKTIAKRLTKSYQEIPHFHLNIECIIDKLILMKNNLNNILKQKNTKLSLNDFIIKATSLTLKKISNVNVSWNHDHIIQHNHSDISVAVSIKDGVITPVIKNAESKGLETISNEMKDLASRARTGKLKIEEYTNGTFTISNLGMLGIKQFNAIINPPQSCVLSIGAANKTAVVNNNDKIEVATIINCTLSVDHRVIDGATGAHFLKYFKVLIEEPYMMLL